MIIDYNLTHRNYQKAIAQKRGRLEYHCPKCGGNHCLHRHGTYSRYLSVWENGAIKTIRVTIQRTKCSVCRTTHAILARDMIPFRIYSAALFMTTIAGYYGVHCPVSKISAALGLSYQAVQTFTVSFMDNIKLMLHRSWESRKLAVTTQQPPVRGQSFRTIDYVIQHGIAMFMHRKSSKDYQLWIESRVPLAVPT